MTAKVVDASAFAAASFLEPNFADIVQRLAGHALHAPTLMRIEIANVCIKKIRAQPSKRDLLVEQHRQSLGIRFELHDVEPSGVLALAEKLNLSAYDASYLWLSDALGAELVTLDDKLRKAAQKI